jgi:putative membrane protein insertion efficiency factor
MLTALQRLLVFVVLLPVVAYRKLISPLKRTPSCRFMPTCSEYAIEAVQTRGVVIGGALATWRILRCNPLCKGGYDPVPDHQHHRHDAVVCKEHR